MSDIYDETNHTTDDENPNSILIDSDPATINDPDRLLGHYREVLKGLWRKTVTDILALVGCLPRPRTSYFQGTTRS